MTANDTPGSEQPATPTRGSDRRTISIREHQALGPGIEFDTIRLLMARWGDLAVDIGDDAAVLGALSRDIAADGRMLVVSTDACVEGVHFLPSWISAADVGARAIAAALSDLAAMGARADAVLCAFVVPEHWRSRIVDVAGGIARVLAPTGAKIVGGNLSAGEAFAITTTVIGSTSRAVARRGAKPGDRLLVTGALGGPGRAVADWYAGATPSDWARERFASPTPRLHEGEYVARMGAHAMLDISDGLAADSRHLAAASGVRLRIEASRLPLGPGVSAAAALVSGEEYELLFAAPPQLAGVLMADWTSVSGTALTDIGEVVSEEPRGSVEIIGLTDADARVEFVHGHDHFTA